MRTPDEWSRIMCPFCVEREMCDQVQYDCPRDDPPMAPEEWEPKVDEAVWLLGDDQLGTKMWVDRIKDDSIILRSIANPKKMRAAIVILSKYEVGNRIFKTAKAMKQAVKEGAPYDR